MLCLLLCLPNLLFACSALTSSAVTLRSTAESELSRDRMVGCMHAWDAWVAGAAESELSEQGQKGGRAAWDGMRPCSTCPEAARSLRQACMGRRCHSEHSEHCWESRGHSCWAHMHGSVEAGHFSMTRPSCAALVLVHTADAGANHKCRYCEKTLGGDTFYVGEYFVDLHW